MMTEGTASLAGVDCKFQLPKLKENLNSPRKTEPGSPEVSPKFWSKDLTFWSPLDPHDELHGRFDVVTTTVPLSLKGAPSVGLLSGALKNGGVLIAPVIDDDTTDVDVFR